MTKPESPKVQMLGKMTQDHGRIDSLLLHIKSFHVKVLTNNEFRALHKRPSLHSNFNWNEVSAKESLYSFVCLNPALKPPVSLFGGKLHALSADSYVSLCSASPHNICTLCSSSSCHGSQVVITGIITSLLRASMEPGKKNDWTSLSCL